MMASSVREVFLDEKVRHLSRPHSYADETDVVDVVETHMAFVFLTRRHAWKMKKPVRRPFLDFTTLESRRRDCAEEVRLNRRLAPFVYLGLVPLTLDGSGGLAVGGRGEPVEWLVHMLRLPAHRMLDQAMANGSLAHEEVRSAAELLAKFYREEPPASPPVTPNRTRFEREVEETHRALSDPDFDLPNSQIEEVTAAQRAFLGQWGHRLDERVAAGRIVEGHGDLRPEHVYLGPPPAVIDCLEFDRSLRILDPAEDLSFLDLECRRLGGPSIGAYVLQVYRRWTGDHPRPELLRFYRSFRAFVRAKLVILHLWDERPEADVERWRSAAMVYLDLAARNLP